MKKKYVLLGILMVCVFSLSSSFYYFYLLPPLAFHIEILQHPDEFIGQGEAYETSIALDSNDYPHISYAATFGISSLYIYTRYNGYSWTFENLPNSTWAAAEITLDLDSNDFPHISYVQYNGGISLSRIIIHYAYFDGSSWFTQIVNGTDWVEKVPAMRAPSIGVDSQGNPHISYIHGGALKYAYKNGTSWVIETLDHARSQSIALDLHDNPHIAYDKGGSLEYARYNGSSWNIETVDSNGVSRVSMALDSQNKPHMSYGYEELKYAYLDGGLWNIQTVPDTIEDHVWSKSIALDSEGNPHISYSCGDGLRYAYYNGTSWSVKIVDSEGIGSWNSIALDSGGYPHFSYASGKLRYAYLAVRPPFIETPLGKVVIYAAPITAVAILTLFILKKKYR